MYLPNPPLVRQLRTFSRLPDRFRRKTDNDWTRANRAPDNGTSFLEGPVFDTQGNLFVTDIPNGRIFRIDARGDWELVVQYDGEPNGMKFIGPNRLLIADYKNGLIELDTVRGITAPRLARKNAERFKGLNDLTIDSAGNVYFTDQGQTGMHDPTGKVLRLGVDGRLDVLLDNGPSPNGLVLSPDERILYVAMTRANAVWRVPLQDDGTVSKVSQFFTSYGPVGPDGLTMDGNDRLLVANPGLGWIWVLNPRGEPVEILCSPAGDMVTNMCFDGPEKRTVYATESSTGTILKLPLDAPLEHEGVTP